MPDTIANNGTAVPDMSRAAAKAIYPNGGRNRTAARCRCCRFQFVQEIDNLLVFCHFVSSFLLPADRADNSQQ